MASKSTFCSIGKYIARVDSELYDWMEEGCMTHLLDMPAKTGLTFLHPKSPEWRSKFSGLIATNKTAAEDMFRTLVLRDTFKTGRDWTSKRENVANSLFPFQQVGVKSSNDKEVVFESGARAVLDPNFIDDSRKKNLAVWTLISGEIPITHDKPARLSNHPSNKTGMYEPTGPQKSSLRFQIGQIVENEYAREELNRRAGNSHTPSMCFVKYALSIVNYLVHTGNDHTVYDVVLPNIAFDNMDFYYLVEPHNAHGSYLLDDHTIQGWWADAGSRRFDIQDLKEKIMMIQCKNNSSSAAIYSQRGALVSAIHEIRVKILHGRAMESADAIVAAYKHMEVSNSIGSVNNVYPDGLARHFSANPGLKLTQDELRYIMYLQFQDLEADHSFDVGRFNYMMNYIGDRLNASNETSRANLRTLVNPSTLKTHIRPKEQSTEIGLFVNSSMFMFVPMSADETHAAGTKHTLTRPRPGANRFYNIQQAIHSAQLRILPELAKEHHAEVVSMLKNLNPEMLTPEAREELKRLLA